MNIQILVYLLFIIFGFLLGSIMNSQILPKIFLKKDIIKISKDNNPGASNVFTHCGVFWGLLCLILDMLKGFLPVFLASIHISTNSILFSFVMVFPNLLFYFFNRNFAFDMFSSQFK